jgi:hypothetical protein
MALIYSLSAECGRDKSAAEAVAKHFEGFAPVLDNGSQYFCETWLVQADDVWWAACHPPGIGLTGLEPQDIPICNALAVALYDRLRTAPPYRFAAYGCEVDCWREYDDLDNDVIERNFSGFVVAEEIWQRLGAPGVFVPFSPGYYWRPFVTTR